jgi:hypothetical protein
MRRGSIAIVGGAEALTSGPIIAEASAYKEMDAVVWDLCLRAQICDQNVPRVGVGGYPHDHAPFLLLSAQLLAISTSGGISLEVSTLPM